MDEISRNNYNEIVENLIYISSIASAKILEIYHLNEFNVSYKNDSTPVTVADKEANRIIMEQLKKNFKNIPIISEECTNPNSIPKTFFLVDPLDGTKEFISRNGEFTVNIGLIINNKPILGIVELPEKKIQYFSNGIESFAKTKNKTKKIKIKKKKKIIKILASRSHMNEKTKSFIQSFKKFKLFQKGSSLKICSIASGEADIYPRFGNTMEWDIGAAHSILQSAGGRIIDLNLKDLKYGKKGLLNESFIATGDIDTEFLKKYLKNC